jgi:pimeloyl-ACP methyl ester carboxylesterase
VATTKTLTFRGLTVAYSEAGWGAPVLAIHGSAGTGRLWAPLADALAERRRVVAPDLFGYGGSAAWTEARGRASDLELVVGLARSLGGPVHLVGHSYGAALAMRAALELGPDVASLALVEPVAFHLLRLERDPAWSEIADVAGRHIALVEAGELEACADAFMSYWIGPAAWAASTAGMRAKIVAAMPKVADEWREALVDSRGLPRYARLRTPTLLVRGTRTTAAARRVIDLLAATLPDNALVEIPGAGHMSPLTHPAAVVDAIGAHVDRVADGARLAA